MFYKLDSRKNDPNTEPKQRKEIGYEEFALAMRDTLKTDSFPRREDNIPDWDQSI